MTLPDTLSELGITEQSEINEFIADNIIHLIDDEDLLNGAINALADERMVAEVLEYSPMFIYHYSEAQQLSIHGAKNVCRYFQSKLRYTSDGGLKHRLPRDLNDPTTSFMWRMAIDQNKVDAEVYHLYYDKTFDEIDELTNANKNKLLEYIVDHLNKATDLSLFDDMDNLTAAHIVEYCMDQQDIDTIYDKITEALYKQLINCGQIWGAHYQQYDGVVVDNNQKKAA